MLEGIFSEYTYLQTQPESFLYCLEFFVTFVTGEQKQNRGLFWGYSGQQVPVSQLQNGVSTFSLPLFIVDFLTFKVYPKTISFFQWKFSKVIYGQIYFRSTMGSISTGEQEEYCFTISKIMISTMKYTLYICSQTFLWVYNYWIEADNYVCTSFPRKYYELYFSRQDVCNYNN